MTFISHFKTWFSLLLIATSLIGVAISVETQAQTLQPRVVLLTSLDFSSLPAIVRWRFKRYNEKLEAVFRKQFEDQGYSLIVKHDADQYELWKTLQSPQNSAVFWVSHAGFGTSGLTGIENPSLIVDKNGFDLANVFKTAHPNLRYLALVGCSSEKIVERLKIYRRHLPNHSQDYVIKAFDKTIDAKKGLRSAISDYLSYFSPDEIQDEVNEVVTPDETLAPKGHPVVVTRHLPEESANKLLPAVRIENRGKVLGVLPAGKPGDDQSMVIYLDLHAKPSSTDLKLIVSAGANSIMTTNHLELGQFQFYGYWNNARWQVFADSKGKPFGVTQHIFQYKGALQF